MDSQPPEFSLPSDFHDRYSQENRIGGGAFSVVYKYRVRSSTPPEFVAVKIIDRDALQARHASLLGYLETEIRALSELQAPNSPAIIRLHAIFTLPKRTLLVFECCDLDFRTYLLHKWRTEPVPSAHAPSSSTANHHPSLPPRADSPSLSVATLRKPPRMTEPEIRYWLLQVREGLRVLRSYAWLHRDLKPENFLLKKKSSFRRGTQPLWERFSLKLTDFGFAKQLTDPTDLTRSTCGTMNYFSPEMISRQSYDYRIDLWAIGVIAVEMVIGRTLFKDSNTRTRTRNRNRRRITTRKKNKKKKTIIQNRIQRIQRFERLIRSFEIEQICSDYNLSPEFQDLLKGLLVEQSQRIEFDVFFNHPFFSQDPSRILEVEVEVREAELLRQRQREGLVDSTSSSSSISPPVSSTVVMDLDGDSVILVEKPIDDEDEDDEEIEGENDEEPLPPVLVIVDENGEDGNGSPIVKPIDEFMDYPSSSSSSSSTSTREDSDSFEVPYFASTYNSESKEEDESESEGEDSSDDDSSSSPTQRLLLADDTVPFDSIIDVSERSRRRAVAVASGTSDNALLFRLRTGTVIFQLRDRLLYKASRRICRIPMPLDPGSEYVFRALNLDEMVLTVMNKFWCVLRIEDDVTGEDLVDSGAVNVVPGKPNYRKQGEYVCVGPDPVFFSLFVGEDDSIRANLSVVLKPKKRGMVGKRVKLLWSDQGHTVEFDILLTKVRV